MKSELKIVNNYITENDVEIMELVLDCLYRLDVVFHSELENNTLISFRDIVKDFRQSIEENT